MLQRFYYVTWRFVQTRHAWLKKRFTVAGQFILAGLFLSALAGLDTNQTQAYMAFTLLLSLLLVSLACNLFFKARFTARRKLPRFATAGEPLKYRVILENRSSKKQAALFLAEEFASRLPTYEELEEANGPKTNKPLFNWKQGRQNRQWLLSQKQPAAIKDQPLPVLLPHGSLEVQVEMLPLRRGRMHFSGLALRCPDPLGLTKANRFQPLPQSLLILPRRYPLPLIRLPGTRKHHPGGVSLAAGVGESEEFYALRDYRPGDPLRKIHWKSWARTGKPIVKEYQDEFFVRHALILDTFQPMTHTENFEEAVSIAASFVCSLETQESLLDLMFVGTEAYCFTSGRGLAHQDKMLEILASVRACTDKTFGALIPLVIAQAPLLSGCICVLLDWDAERKQLIDLLCKLGLPVLVLVITDRHGPASRDPGPLKHAPASLRFLETHKIQEGLALL